MENFQNLLTMTKEIRGCERMDENGVYEWLKSDDLELEIVDNAVSRYLQFPEARDVANRVTAEDAFNNLKVQLITIRYYINCCSVLLYCMY